MSTPTMTTDAVRLLIRFADPGRTGTGAETTWAKAVDGGWRIDHPLWYSRSVNYGDVVRAVVRGDEFVVAALVKRGGWATARVVFPTEAQAEDVRTILTGLGVDEDTPQIELWNKIDRLEGDVKVATEARADRDKSIFAVSAVTGEGLDGFLDAVTEALGEERRTDALTLGFDEGRKRAWLFEKGLVEEEHQTDDGYEVTVTWSARDRARFGQL